MTRMHDVDVFYFSEMPFYEVSQQDLDAHEASRLTPPNELFDPRRASVLLRDFFDEYLWAEECGFDGLMVNEHHNSPTCMHVSANISASILARSTTRAKLLILGNMLPVWDNPVRLAEEVAFADVLSGGRVISGIVRGIGPETWATNSNPVHNRARFEEAHDLMVKTWTTPGPWRYEGVHYHFRVVNPWMLPIQVPHPPVWTPGTGSPETVHWAADHHYTYAAFLTPLDTAARLFDIYRARARENGVDPGPDKFAFMVPCIVADTDAAAQELATRAVWRYRNASRAPKEYWLPPGYAPLPPRDQLNDGKTIANAAKSMAEQTVEELQANDHLVAGSPATVTKKLGRIVDQLGIGHLLLEGQVGPLGRDETMRCIELLGKEVIPALKGC
jgi:alkanesulfonate monooxygenase SsuD/methylene tetrahydromethanopterin reductase-like flavin-dependent oxidoreductase (luciferase family)